jgi:glycosyltransferase involved in cell wall biosynthesis
MLFEYLRGKRQSAQLVTPFSWAPALAVAVFGLRRVVGPLNGSLSVWWYRSWHYVFLLQAMKRALRSGEPLVVYAQCPLSAQAALQARVNHRQRVVLIVHFNVSQAEEWVGTGHIARDGLVYRQILELEADVLPRVDGIVYPSAFSERMIQTRILGLEGTPSIVSPNFVSRVPRADAAESGNDLISIGTLEPRKNQSYLLHVLAEANRRGRRYSLTLVGHGPDRRRLEALASWLAVEGQVQFLGFQGNAARLMRGHRVYVHSSLMENLPIVLIEALAAGLPVLAGPVGGIPEVFSDGVEGCYWPLDDPAAGASRLIAVLENRARYAALANAAMRRFDQRFETSVVASRLLEFLCCQVASGEPATMAAVQRSVR